MIYIKTRDKLLSLKLKESFMIFDFDRTMTTDDSLTSWSVIENSSLLSNGYKTHSKELYDYYRKLEIDDNINYELKQKLMEEWMFKQLELFSMSINEELFEQLLKEVTNIKFKKGIDIFFKKMNDLDIPIIVISAGLGNVVKEAMRVNGCLYDNVSIISNMLTFDGKFKIDGQIVNSVNKASLPISNDIHLRIDNKSNVLLFGDQISDLTCLENFNAKRNIKVGFLSKETSKYFNEYLKQFDIVCNENANYEDLCQILIKKR